MTHNKPEQTKGQCLGYCGAVNVVLYDDPKTPPMDDKPCLCTDCRNIHTEDVIEELEQRIDDIKPPTPPDRIVIQRKIGTRDRDGLIDTDIVLCFLPDNDCTPFATWEASHENGATFQGHYFDSLEDALTDFSDR